MPVNNVMAMSVLLDYGVLQGSVLGPVLVVVVVVEFTLVT